MNDWDAPLKDGMTPGSVYEFARRALNKNPALSMLTREAREAIAMIVADAMPNKEA